MTSVSDAIEYVLPSFNGPRHTTTGSHLIQIGLLNPVKGVVRVDVREAKGLVAFLPDTHVGAVVDVGTVDEGRHSVRQEATLQHDTFHLVVARISAPGIVEVTQGRPIPATPTAAQNRWRSPADR